MSNAQDSLAHRIEEERRSIAKDETEPHILEQAEDALKEAKVARAARKPREALRLLWMAETWASLLNHR